MPPSVKSVKNARQVPVRSDLLTPQTWLAAQPLKADERLYLILSAASDADPLKALYQHESNPQLTPIWAGTPYASWQPVMPYLGELKLDSSFLNWITSIEVMDWGWLAVSRSESQTVFEHLRSLSQVLMPDGTEVFFRFWDGRYLYPIIKALSVER